MKTLIILPFFLLAFLGAVSSARAQTSHVYFAGYMGLVRSHDQPFAETTSGSNGDIEMDNANSFAGALGLRFSRNLRLEAELGYRSQNIDSMDTATGSFDLGGDITTTSAMLNVFYDFDVPWKFQPFVTAGLGLAWIEADIRPSGGPTPVAADDSIDLTWAVGGGLKYRMSPTLAFTGGYRYLDMTDLELGSYDIEYSNHEFRVGLEYDLPVKIR